MFDWKQQHKKHVQSDLACGQAADTNRRLRGMRKFTSLLIILLITAGCSAEITTHDKVRAAELITDFLSSLKTEQGVHTSYDWTDDRFKKEISFDEFRQIISSIRSKNSGADIHLTGYETFGSKEMIVVYASSEIDDGKLHFKFSLVGTRHKDYYLLNFSTNGDGFSKNGIYRDYEKPIIVHGV